MLIDKYSSKLIILVLLHLITRDAASPCIFTKNIHSNGVQQQLQVESWGSDSIRIRLSPDVIIQTPDYQALLPEKPTLDKEDCQQLNQKTFTNGNIEFILNDDNQTWSIQRPSDELTLFQVQSTEFLPYIYPISIYSPIHTLYKVSLNYIHIQNGYLYGLGEHHYADNLTLPYHNFHLSFNFSSTAPSNGDITIPWYIHSSGFGILWNQPGYGSFDVQNDSQIMWIASATHQLDLWITTIPETESLSSLFYPILMKNYVDVVGHPNPLPHFASGFWQSKNRYRSQQEFLDVAKGYYDRQIPVGIIVIDYYHWPALGDWKFNSSCWPDVPEMINQINSYGMKVMVSVWPHVAENSENFITMETKGLLTHDANGSAITTSRNLHISDEYNPATRQFIWDKVKAHYYDYGIKVYWLDADEPEGSRPGLQWWYDRHDDEIAMVYAREHQRTFWDGLRGEKEEEIIMLSRQAWIGSHTINVAVWSGDIDSTWKELLKQIKVAQNVALSGIYWWTTDIGGYQPAGLDDDQFQELLLRWFQFGAFCPIFRLHGYRNPPLPDNECGFSGGHNEVWLFKYSSQIIDIIKLRESLRDYVEYHLNITHQNGTPILRPMFYDFNNDIQSYQAEDQYMFGTDYLVAPVYTYQPTSRSVYLPNIDQQNSAWQHYYTKQIYQGGQRYDINTTLNDFPLFIKTTSNCYGDILHKQN
jgi:alpha-D-xyloside xylohydrolase